MDISLTGVGTLLTGLAWLFFYLKLRSNTAVNNDFIKFFKGFSLNFGLFFLIFSIPLVMFSDNSSLLGISYLIGHIFSYISFAYLIRVGLLLAKPSFNSVYVFIGYLIAGTAVTILNIYNFNYPYIQNGVAQWGQVPSVAIAIALMSVFAFLPVAVLFIKEAVSNPKNRRRYSLIGIALLITIVCGPIHDATSSVLLLTIADLLNILACVLMFAGVIAEPKTSKVQSRVTV